MPAYATTSTLPIYKQDMCTSTATSLLFGVHLPNMWNSYRVVSAPTHTNSLTHRTSIRNTCTPAIHERNTE